MRRLHLIVGMLFLVVFLGTGQYMDRVHGHLEGMADGPRMIYRSAHIYLLFGALMNVLLGAYLRPLASEVARSIQRVASSGILALPFFFAAAFFVEPGVAELERPWARPGIYLSLAAVGLHFLAVRLDDRDRGHAAVGDVRKP